MKKILTRATLLLAALLLPLSGFAQGYHSNDITPAGSASGKLTAAVSGRQIGGAQAAGSYAPHAVMLSGNALTAVDLNPATAYQSFATCADDSQEGGWASFPTGLHAVVWSGSAASCVDLNPSGYNFSYCLGVHLGEQVGYAQQQSYFVTASHAYCWYGSAASGVDLHPAGIYPYSRAVACNAGEEVGYVANIAYPEGDYLSYHNGSRATRWQGSAASAVDLHPVGFDASEATCTNGLQQGGWGYLVLGATRTHALLWSGTPESVVDLHPAGYSESRVNAISDTQQVGDGWVGIPGAIGSVRHALAWTGSAASVVDLNQYLPAGYVNGVATGIDADGNIVGYAYNVLQAGVTIPQGAIAVVFAPGNAPAAQLASLVLNSADVAPNIAVTATASLAGQAPAGGVTLDFLSTNLSVVATPASVTIPAGQSSASFSVAIGGGTLTTPANLRLYATDGGVSRYAALTVTPVVKLASVSANPVEGGFSTYGTITLSIPAQAGGATVSLASGNPALLTVPATVLVPQGYQSVSFLVNTSAVAVLTNVPVTATFNGTTVSGSVAVNAAPVVSLASIVIPEVVGGQSVTGTVTLNNFSRTLTGSVVALSSGDATLQLPATVTIPYGAYSASFVVTTSVVPAAKAVTAKATYNGGSLTGTASVLPIPTVTIVSADWDPATLLFKVQADTSYANSILTFGNESGPIGTMQLELGVWKGSTLMATAPKTATVWNSNGGQASMAVTIKGVKTSGGGGTGGGGTGGGGSTSTSYKLTLGKTGKGTITATPSAATYAPGTVVTLTATPDAGSPWIGWTGSVTSTAKTITVTMNSALSLTANFK